LRHLAVAASEFTRGGECRGVPYVKQTPASTATLATASGLCPGYNTFSNAEASDAVAAWDETWV